MAAVLQEIIRIGLLYGIPVPNIEKGKGGGDPTAAHYETWKTHRDGRGQLPAATAGLGSGAAAAAATPSILGRCSVGGCPHVVHDDSDPDGDGIADNHSPAAPTCVHLASVSLDNEAEDDEPTWPVVGSASYDDEELAALDEANGDA